MLASAIADSILEILYANATILEFCDLLTDLILMLELCYLISVLLYMHVYTYM